MRARRKGDTAPFDDVYQIVIGRGLYAKPIPINDVEFEQENKPIPNSTEAHRENVRERAAIVAMQGIMNFFGSLDYNKETIADLAVKQADALVERLKKDRNETTTAYVVTRCEEHSDYVERVFLNESKAEAYCDKFNGNEDEYSRHITKIDITL